MAYILEQLLPSQAFKHRKFNTRVDQIVVRRARENKGEDHATWRSLTSGLTLPLGLEKQKEKGGITQGPQAPPQALGRKSTLVFLDLLLDPVITCSWLPRLLMEPKAGKKWLLPNRHRSLGNVVCRLPVT